MRECSLYFVPLHTVIYWPELYCWIYTLEYIHWNTHVALCYYDQSYIAENTLKYMTYIAGYTHWNTFEYTRWNTLLITHVGIHHHTRSQTWRMWLWSSRIKQARVLCCTIVTQQVTQILHTHALALRDVSWCPQETSSTRSSLRVCRTIVLR
jgi:hypothetical protein